MPSCLVCWDLGYVISYVRNERRGKVPCHAVGCWARERVFGRGGVVATVDIETVGPDELRRIMTEPPRFQYIPPLGRGETVLPKSLADKIFRPVCPDCLERHRAPYPDGGSFDFHFNCSSRLYEDDLARYRRHYPNLRESFLASHKQWLLDEDRRKKKMSMKTTCPIVGARYHEGAIQVLAKLDAIVRKGTHGPGCTKLELRREPNNPHDPNAVAVWARDMRGYKAAAREVPPLVHVGYLLRQDARAVARVMDAGVSVRAIYQYGSTAELFWPASTKEGVEDAYRRAMREAEGI